MTKGKLLLIISAFIYGILPVLAAIAYRGGVNGITLTFLRSSISIPVLYAMIRADGRRLHLSRSVMRRVIILGIFGGALPILLLYLSYHYIATGLATTLHFVYPLIIVLSSAVIYHEKLSGVTLGAVVFVTVGIFMFSDISHGASTAGIILAILSGIFYSFYVIYIERSGLESMDYIVLTFYVMVIMSVSVLIFGAVTGALSFDISPLAWSVSAIISFLVTLGAMPLLQLGVRYEGASTAGILSTIEPITSVIMGAVFLGEHIGTGQMMGGAMILFGVLLAEKAPQHKKSTV
ncbi:MAG: DMT family transporter [Clostridiales bacterium]|nr:DMT family transporter [Clostridiales bacterium]